MRRQLLSRKEFLTRPPSASQDRSPKRREGGRGPQHLPHGPSTLDSNPLPRRGSRQPRNPTRPLRRGTEGKPPLHLLLEALVAVLARRIPKFSPGRHRRQLPWLSHAHQPPLAGKRALAPQPRPLKGKSRLGPRPSAGPGAPAFPPAHQEARGAGPLIDGPHQRAHRPSVESRGHGKAPSARPLARLLDDPGRAGSEGEPPAAATLADPPHSIHRRVPSRIRNRGRGGGAAQHAVAARQSARGEQEEKEGLPERRRSRT